MTMRIALSLALVPLTIAFVACDGNGASQPTPGATRSATTIDIGPYPQPTAFANRTGAEIYVLDAASGDVYVFEGAWPGLRWVDDRTLATDLGTRVDLAQRSHMIGEFDDPAAPALGRAFTSPDGEWILEVSGAQTAVVAADGSQRIALTAVANQPANTDDTDPQPEFAWSPTGHLLAIGGGRCGDSPLQLVDPDTGSITLLNDPGTRAMDYAWRPDGAAIAVSLLDAETNARLVLYDVASGVTTTLIPDSTVVLPRELMDLAWNPGGTRLLFTIYTHRPCPF
jgi:hypothetical protein